MKPIPQHEAEKLKRENRELKKYLANLTTTVRACLAQLDKVMQGPSTPERGSQIAKISNVLEMANDQARHFGLHIDLKTGKVKKTA